MVSRCHYCRGLRSAAGARLLEVAIDSAGGAVDSTAAVAANLPPAWVDITADIREEVIAVRQKMAELKGYAPRPAQA